MITALADGSGIFILLEMQFYFRLIAHLLFPDFPGNVLMISRLYSILTYVWRCERECIMSQGTYYFIKIILDSNSYPIIAMGTAVWEEGTLDWHVHPQIQAVLLLDMHDMILVSPRFKRCISSVGSSVFLFFSFSGWATQDLLNNIIIMDFAKYYFGLHKIKQNKCTAIFYHWAHWVLADPLKQCF